MLIADALVVAISAYTPASPFERENYEYAWGIVAVALFVHLEVTIAQNFKNIKRSNSLSLVHWFTTLSLPLFSMFLAILISYSPLNQFLTLMGIVIILVINVLTLHIHDTLSITYSQKLQLTLSEQEKSYYFNQCELMQRSAETLRAFRHDIQKHLFVVKDYIKEGNHEQAHDYLLELIGEAAPNVAYSDSGNTAFDSIINYKLINTVELGIEVELDIAIPENINVEVADIVTILGNLLDNAIEATAEAENKHIHVAVHFDKGRLFISVTNSFSGELKYVDDALATSKHGTRGYGLKNIRKSVTKYNGQLIINHKDTMFTAEVFLYAMPLNNSIESVRKLTTV
jgi:sensor histidine kinase YesM